MAAVLNDIGVYKNQLLSLFLDSADICGCLLDGQDGSRNTDTLLNRQVYPYLYVDNAREEPLAYLGIEVDIPKFPSAATKNIKVTIWAYCHKTVMAYEKEGYSGTRADILADMADRQIAGSGLSGIGTLNMTSALHFSPDSNYYGVELIYTTSDYKVKR